MSWELSIRVTHFPPDGNGRPFPVAADDPCYSFDRLEEVVELLQEVGRAQRLGGLDEYAGQVEREGRVIERTLARRRWKDAVAVRAALNRLCPRNRLAEGNGSGVVTS